MKTINQSNTIRLGILQIASGVVGYLTGQMEEAGAGALVFSGLVQIIQRLWSLRAEGAAASAPAAEPPVNS